MGLTRGKLKRFLTDYLKPYDFQDYGPNGLQIEGKEDIQKIAFAVSATRASAEEAAEKGADALIVHHGLFWKFHGTRPLVGPFAKRVFPLVKHNINLFGYHLPLDAHPEIGNAVALGRLLGLEDFSPFGDYKGCPTGTKARLPQPVRAKDFENKLQKVLDHPVLYSGASPDTEIEKVGIITGGANGDWWLAQREGLDAYVTGEMSEHDWHEAQEAGMHMFAGGHHATEQFGIQSLMGKIEAQFEVDCFYIDSHNPA